MKFTIFHKTSEIHFDHNGIDDYDGDEGYYEDIEIADEEVHRDVVEMIYRDYFNETLSPLDKSEFYTTIIERTKLMIKLFIDDLDKWDKVIEMYHDELQEKYEAEYGD